MTYIGNNTKVEKIRDEVRYNCGMAIDELEDYEIDEAIEIMGGIQSNIKLLDTTENNEYVRKFDVAIACLTAKDEDVGTAMSNIGEIKKAVRYGDL